MERVYQDDFNCCEQVESITHILWLNFNKINAYYLSSLTIFHKNSIRLEK